MIIVDAPICLARHYGGMLVSAEHGEHFLLVPAWKESLLLTVVGTLEQSRRVVTRTLVRIKIPGASLTDFLVDAVELLLLACSTDRRCCGRELVRWKDQNSTEWRALWATHQEDLPDGPCVLTELRCSYRAQEVSWFSGRSTGGVFPPAYIQHVASRVAVAR